MTSLPKAADDGDIDAVGLHLENGQASQANKDLALARACCSGHTEIAELLFEHGADPNGQYQTAPGEFRYGPIILASCEFLNPVGVKWLLDNGANPNGNPPDSKHFQSNTPLEMVRDTYVTNEENRIRCIELLVAAGGRLPDDMVNPDGQ